jgi:acyl carrier protein
MTTFDGIRALIVRDFDLPAERLRRETPLTEIELDSLAITELVFAIEDEFHVTADNSIPRFEKLGEIADYIDRLIAERDTKPSPAAKPAAAKQKPATAKRARAAKPKEPATGPKRANGAGVKKVAADAKPRRRKPADGTARRKPKHAPIGARGGTRAR